MTRAESAAWDQPDVTNWTGDCLDRPLPPIAQADLDCFLDPASRFADPVAPPPAVMRTDPSYADQWAWWAKK